MDFDPDSITQEKLHALRNAAEYAWGEDTRAPDFQGHPQPSAGQCFVTSSWLAGKLGGHVGTKDGHYFWVSPDNGYVIDLTGDNNASEPIKHPPHLQDADDEPYEHHPDKLKHLPGPVIYVKSDHPLYKGFRVKSYPDHPRTKAFKLRADKALEGKRTADLMGDALPAQEPQAAEDFANKYFHDTISDMQLTMEEPQNDEYKFFYGNGQLHVSPIHNHNELRDHAGVPANHTGPIAVGYVNVHGGEALWSVESNIALRGFVSILKEYCKDVGWKWGGLVGSDGQPIAEDLGAKKSMWYGWNDEVLLSEHPFYGATGHFDITGRTANVHSAPAYIREGIREWADDNGFHVVSEYPGGTDMNDRIKNKEWPTQYDRGNPEAEPETQPEFEVPQGELTCPKCGMILDDYNAYVLHTKDHEPMDAKPEVEEGHFPYPEDKDEPLPLHNRNVMPTALPLA